VGCVERSVRNLGGPLGSCCGKAVSHGIRILSPTRGNLDTEVGRSLPDTDSTYNRKAKPSRNEVR
jgi:hypothetical protein